MPVGLGLTPLGTSFAGYGQVDTVAGPPKGIYIDAANGQQWDSRKIDPFSGRYVKTASGTAQGMSGVQQMVLIAIKTVRNTAVVKNIGNGAFAIQKVGRDVQKQISDALRLALKPLVDAKQVQISSIDFGTPPTGTAQFVTLRWIDVTTGLEQQNQV